MGFFTIQKRLLPIKFHYALSSGMASVQPALPVYQKVLRFSSFIVGTIATILPILGLIIKPAFGAISDKFKCHRAVLITWEVVMIVGFFSIQFIPVPDIAYANSTKVHSVSALSACSAFETPSYFLAQVGDCTWQSNITIEQCHQWNLTSNDCGGPPYYITAFQTSCIPVATHLLNMKIIPSSAWNITCPPGIQPFDAEDNTMDDADTFSTWQFWVFLLLLVATSGGTTVVSTLTDTICIEICGDASLYGKQRLWSSLAWGTVAIASGFIVDAVSVEGEEKNYTPVFYIMLVPLLIDLVVSYNLKFDLPARSQSMGKDVWKIVAKPRTVLFMFWCGMVGLSFGLLWNFLFWLLEDLAAALGNDVTSKIKTIEGLVTGFQSFLGEVPAFFFGGSLINKLGHGHAISIVLCAIGLRFTFYSILVNPWWCLPIEVLQTDYGLFYSTMTSYAKKVSLPGTEATIQSIMSAICEGVGAALGSFLAGSIYNEYGGSMAFRIFGISYLAMAVVNEIIEFLLRTIEKRSEKKSPPTAEEKDC